MQRLMQFRGGECNPGYFCDTQNDRGSLNASQRTGLRTVLHAALRAHNFTEVP